MRRSAFHPAPASALALVLAGWLLGGCAAPPTGLPRGARPGVHLSPLGELGRNQGRERVFFAEYLEDVGTTTRRVAVLAEPVGGPLRLVFNPGRYVSGEVGAGDLGALVARFAPLRPHLVRDHNGQTLGYALLAPEKSLHLVALNQKRYVLDFKED